MQFRIDKNAVAVQIRNFSRYFLGVYFGSDPPSGSSTTALAPGFHTVIAPGEQPVLPIVGNYATDRALFPNGLTEFTGDVFLQPISIDAGLVLTGSSSLNYATLTSYLSGEGLPESTAAPRVMDASNQQRVMMIPISAPNWTNNFNPNAAGNTIVIADFALTPANIQINTVNFYLYAWQAGITSLTGASVFLEYKLQLLLQDATHTTLAGFGVQDIYYGFGAFTQVSAVGITQQGMIAPNSWPPAGVVPRLGFNGFVPHSPAAAFVRLQVIVLTISGTPRMDFNCLADTDQSGNQFQPFDIGNFNLGGPY